MNDDKISIRKKATSILFLYSCYYCFFVILVYFSYITPTTNLYTILTGIFCVAGLLGPMLVAFCLILKDSDLSNDLSEQIFSLKRVGLIYILLFFLMLFSILLAQSISIIFGYSVSQFRITGHFSFSSGVFPVWFLLLLAPTIEELGWHIYATDALRNKFNLFYTSIIFAFYWGIWHIPLSFIKHYYQSNLIEAGWIHSVNFLVSIFPFVIIMNWLYYKANRNILIPIVFHITAGYFNEIFVTHPDTKIIQTVLLLFFSIILVLKQKEFFFKK